MSNDEKKRNDRQCPTCQRYRHRTCQSCGTTNLIPDAMNRLIDHGSRALHVCGAAPTITPAATPAVIETKTETTASPWDEQMAKLVPPYSVFERYVVRHINGMTDLDIMERAYYSHKNILLVGDTGTGKSHLVEALAAKLRVPCVTISLNGGTTVEDIVGQPLFVNGSTVWVDGIVPFFMRHGGIVCYDEVNACPREIAFVLNQVLDWRRRLTLVQNGREVIEAHPAFFQVGAMNPDYHGTKQLNEAFENRFRLLPLDYNRDVERALGIDEKMLDLAEKLRDQYRNRVLSKPTSTRSLLDYMEDRKDFDEEVARQFFLARYASKDRAAVKEVFEMHMGVPKTKALNLD